MSTRRWRNIARSSKPKGGSANRKASSRLVQVSRIMQVLGEVMLSEEENLYKYPKELIPRMQSAYLLGYADCWKKIFEALAA